MKITAWGLIMCTLVLFVHEQQATASIGGAIISQEGNYMVDRYIYPGEYTIHAGVRKDNLGCSLRMGTKSSNPKLLNISGPLAIRNVTDPPTFFKKILENFLGIGMVGKQKNFFGISHIEDFPFLCATKGTIRVSNPPTVTVPVMVTLTYGPFLKKTKHLLVTQKIGIKSVSASPVRRTYSRGQSVTLAVNFTRKRLRRAGEHYLIPKWRVKQGKLCASGLSAPTNEWKEVIPDQELNGKLTTKSVTLCESGKTIVEFGFKKTPMTDSRIKRLVFNVAKRAAPKRRTSQIRSRGIGNPPPLIVPDPEPPALPNFELQGEKP